MCHTVSKQMSTLGPLSSRTKKQRLLRPVTRIFRRQVTWVSDVYVCMHKHAKVGGPGGMLPHEVLHPIFDCPRMHLLSQMTSNSREKVLSLAEQQVGRHY